jgi:hypothetical protein
MSQDWRKKLDDDIHEQVMQQIRIDQAEREAH